MYEELTRKSSPTVPSGVQVQVAIAPPLRQTRAISSAALWWRGANMCPKVETTLSNAPSSNGIASASPSTQSTATPAAAASERYSLTL